MAFTPLAGVEDPGFWIQAVLIVVFLFGGMVRAIAKAVKPDGAKGGASGRPRTGSRPAGGARQAPASVTEGLDRWAQLLRGEVPTEKTRAPVARVERVRPPAPQRVELAEPLTELVSSRASRAPLPSAERARRSAEQAPSPPPSPVLVEPAAPQVVDAETQRQADALVQLNTPPLSGPGTSTQAHTTLRPALRSWRQAIVTAELLGPPCALRPPGVGPVGLRQ